jgi:predicted anti-sigma-YlaC factor YlaD
VCQQAVELVTDYLENALPLRERSRFEAHLAGCPHCRAYLDQMRDTMRTLGRIDPGTVPPEVLAGLVAVYRRMRSGS